MLDKINQFFQSISDFFDVPFFQCNDDFIIITTNNAAINLFPEIGDILNKNFFSLPLKLVDDDFESFLEKIYLISSYSGEIIKQNNGKVQTYLLNAKRLKSPFDNKIYYAIKLIDKESEEFIKSELRKSQEEIRMLAIHLQNAREEERSKIARELHDDIGQLLTILKMDFQSILMNNSLSKEEIIEKIRNAIVILDEIISITRKIISELRLAVLDHLGLVPALEHLVDEFKERTKINIKCNFDREIKLNKEIEIHLFRVCQELLANVRKHSQATYVEFNLQKIDKNLIIQINDNGIGFDKNELSFKNAFGLLGIRERIHILNGKFDLSSSKGNGTKVKIIIPINYENSNSR